MPFTVFIIFQYTDDYEFEFKEIIDSIECQKSGKNITYCILKVETRKNKASLICYSWNLSDNPESQIQSLEEFDFYDENNLISFFRENKGVRNLLITRGHSYGMALFPERIEDKIRENREIDLDNFFLLANLSLLKSNDSERIKKIAGLVDDEIVKYYSAEAFNEILKKSFGNKKLDLFVANNCYAQLFETGFAFCEQVEILIASQVLNPATGMNYLAVFREINANSNIQIEQLAKCIVTTYKEKYDEKYIKKIRELDSQYENYNFEQMSLSANHIAEYDQLFCVINNIAHLFIELYNSNQLQVVYNSRDQLADLTQKNYGFIDFFHFLDLLIPGEIKDNKLLESYIEQFKEMKESILLKNFTFEAIVKDEDNTRIKHPQFFNIFFPQNKSEMARFVLHNFYDSNNNMNNKFLMLSKWDDFINIYL